MLLSYAPKPTMAELEAKRSRSGPGETRELLVVVDPDPLERELVAASLALHDPSAEVVALASMNEALELVNSRPVEVVVLAAPASNPTAGSAAQVRAWRLAAPHVPMVLLCDERPTTGLADRWLARPLDLDRLFAIVDDAANRGK